jgi:choline dehydrogenase-like flavoprotein
MTSPVDVLIIGAGASGAAVGWSLADTKMHILCLEQGDWMKPSEYPSTGRDWEARQLDDFHISPNRRARETDYPVNDASSRSRSPISTASAAAPCSTQDTFRVFILRIFVCAHSTALATIGR